MQASLRKAFFDYGWLTPVLLPLTQIGGRGLFNFVSYGYVIWAMFSLFREKLPQSRMVLILYGSVLVAFALGIPGAEDSFLALKDWLIFLLRSLVVVFTLMMLEREPANLSRLQQALGFAGLLTLLALYLDLGYLLSSEHFDPRFQLKEDNLPFLFPFMLVTIASGVKGHWRYPCMVVVSTAVLAYVVLSGGRAALLGLLVAVAVYGLVVLRWRPLWVGSGILALLVAGLLLMPRAANLYAGWSNPWDVFTSGRNVLWQHALEHPPARPLIGIGMGNGRYEEEILQINARLSVKHLHNFVLDAWRETGLLGVAALLSLITYAIGKPLWVWSRLDPSRRRQAGLFLAAALAILSAGLLSFSYASRYFSVYLFFLFAGLVHVGREGSRG